MPDALYHISDQPDIARFDPRPAPSPRPGLEGQMVWAIDRDHLHNYLLPRDCPRVTFYALPESAPEDIDRLMAGSSAKYVVAIEARWLPTVRRERLYQYELPPESFVALDEGAGYYISRAPVAPRAVTPIEDLLVELTRHDVELRVMPSLWKLRDLVIGASLQFSIIRMRNAQPPEDGMAPHYPL
jgi:hypothetical protein